ncbi:hypothetical protein [Nocardiopsis sp. NRRL B-16309]|uniref:hypothetical protein n=1 Tax=Nocardiopsis sp. NRRL B-16309 TaxID=1519494 RepID=UPI001E31F233|nr:hypothetical protein [Nocardiopsis sp. NRRL B-16309]
MAAYFLDEGGRESHGGVVGFDRLLQPRHIDVRRVAAAGLVGDTEEVGVLGAVPVGGLLDDHAAVYPAGAAAVTAQERALEVVVVLAPPLLGGRAAIRDGLHPIEQLHVHQRLMPPGVLLALVGDVADVVAVAQYPRQLADRHRL